MEPERVVEPECVTEPERALEDIEVRRLAAGQK